MAGHGILFLLLNLEIDLFTMNFDIARRIYTKLDLTALKTEDDNFGDTVNNYRFARFSGEDKH